MRRPIQLLLCSLLFASSCTYGSLTNEMPYTTQQADGNKMIIGEKLENPYSLKNMQKALDSLVKLKSFNPGTQLKLETTDYYVRFRPTDTTQYRTLFEQGFELFDYPLDCEILSEGSYYHDPDIPEDEITWQYTIIPVSKLDSSINNEKIYKIQKTGDDITITDCNTGTSISGPIIEDCYIPGDDVKATSKLPVSAEELENMSISLTHPNDLITDTKASGTGYPRGYVKVYDDISGVYVSVPGVKVQARYFLKWKSSYTDSNGYFYINSSFKKNSYLSVIFDNSKGFSVWGNFAFLAPAYYNCGKQSSFSNEIPSIKIDENKQSWPWAVISKSAYDYYTSCASTSGLLYGVQMPHSDLKIWSVGNLSTDASTPMARHLTAAKTLSALGTMLSFCSSCLSLQITSSIVAFALHIALPDMFIGSKNSNYRKLYLSIQHEFTHASHFRQLGEWKWGDVIWYEIKYQGYPDSTKNYRGEEYVRLTESYSYSIENYINKNLFDPWLTEGQYNGKNWFFKETVCQYSNILIEHILKPKDFSYELKSSLTTSELNSALLSNYPTAQESLKKILSPEP